MKSRLQVLREQKSFTQTELAEKAGVSVRTVQRIEAGQIPKGFTLKVLATALDIDAQNLLPNIQDAGKTIDLSRAKMINLSSLLFIIPFGSVIFPAILTYKTPDENTKNVGRQIISLQILFAVITSTLMILSPFMQKYLDIKIPLFILFLVLMKSLNIFVIIKNGMRLNEKSELYMKLKYSIL